jgi:hypothetical protein
MGVSDAEIAPLVGDVKETGKPHREENISRREARQSGLQQHLFSICAVQSIEVIRPHQQGLQIYSSAWARLSIDQIACASGTHGAYSLKTSLTEQRRKALVISECGRRL